LANQRVLVLGLTFKENIPDFRNSKSLDLVRELQTYGLKVDTFDPHVDVKTFKADPECHDVAVLPSAPKQLSSYVAIVLTVGHREFLDESWINKVSAAKKGGAKVFDLKNAWNENEGLADWTP
jgi:UDP-N-acetyl-D-galactosamine dehydrogenase